MDNAEIFFLLVFFIIIMLLAVIVSTIKYIKANKKEWSDKRFREEKESLHELIGIALIYIVSVVICGLLYIYYT